MKKVFGTMSVMILLALLLSAWLPAAAASDQTKIKLLNPPKNGVLELGVGESYTLRVQVRSKEPFVWAMAKLDQYYPGRGIFATSSVHAPGGTTALLEITITGKNSTADLPAVSDWYGQSWPAGVAPVAIVAGVQYPGGAIGEYFPFMVIVE